jgi:hypothetical protein
VVRVVLRGHVGQRPGPGSGVAVVAVVVVVAGYSER